MSEAKCLQHMDRLRTVFNFGLGITDKDMQEDIRPSRIVFVCHASHCAFGRDARVVASSNGLQKRAREPINDQLDRLGHFIA